MSGLVNIKLAENSVWASVRASVRASMSDSVEASVSDSVSDSVWASVLDSVWASRLASVSDSVWASVRASVEKIEIADVLSETNVEVRREIIRKIGVERWIAKTGAKVLDRKNDYELLSIKLSDDVPDARYLKMINPSLGIYHIEGVEGDTVQEALDFRAGGIPWNPCKVT